MKYKNNSYQISSMLTPTLLISSLALAMSACSYQSARQNSEVSQHPAISMIDSDRDGVRDDLDMCPATPANVLIDRNGCPPHLLPSENDLMMEVRVFYDEGSSEIPDKYLAAVNRAGEVMKERSDTKIQIEGHISQPENTPLNQTLAQTRAEGVKKHLMLKYGIDAERIHTATYAADRPIAPNDYPEGVGFNQRVYALVTNFDENDVDDTRVNNLLATPEGISQVVNASNQFAIEMYQQVNGQNTQAENIFFSPYSLSTAVAMLYNAAAGDTKQQIGQVFHYPDLAVLNPNSGALYSKFNGSSGQDNRDYTLVTANDLWVQQGFNPSPTYIDVVTKHYGSKVTPVNFSTQPEAARHTINTAIANHTQQMIPELLPQGSISSRTNSVLTNAIYFKGLWQSPLRLLPDDQPFYKFDDTSLKVPMMFKDSTFAYGEDDKVQLIALPYKGDELSMLIVLPKDKDKAAMGQLVNQLDMQQLIQWTTRLEQKQVQLTLPKFKLDQRYQITELLKAMGMPMAFAHQADFSKYSEITPLTVDGITHQAVIEVDEAGTKAAAGSAIAVSPVSLAYHYPIEIIEFTADHPFMFMIKDNATGAILFMGQVNEPA